jgi:hypothetical protein
MIRQDSRRLFVAVHEWIIDIDEYQIAEMYVDRSMYENILLCR